MSSLVKGIVEPGHCIIGLMIATSPRRPDGPDLCLRVLDTTDQEIVINEGTVTGQFVPVDEVETIAPGDGSQPAFRKFNTTQGVEIPSHLSAHLEEWSKDLNEEQKKLLKT